MNARVATTSAMIVCAVAVLAACDSGSDAPPAARPSSAAPAPGTAPDTTPGTAPGGCADPGAGTAAAGAEVVPAPNNGLPRTTAGGEPLVVEAVVLRRDCRPAAGATVFLWHTDARGLYGPAGTRRCCYYAGTVRGDGQGRFRVRTIRPAQYPEPGAPPAHIHLEIRHAAGTLETEIIFDRPPPTGPLAPSGAVVPTTLSRDGAGWRGAVAFVLSGTG